MSDVNDIGGKSDGLPQPDAELAKRKEEIARQVALKHQDRKIAFGDPATDGQATLATTPSKGRFSIARRRINDRIFDSAEAARLAVENLSAQDGNEWLRKDIALSVDVAEDRATTPVLIPPTVAVSLATAAHMAFDWQSIPAEEESKALDATVARFVNEMKSADTTDNLTYLYPHWQGIFRVLVADVLDRGGKCVELLRHGIDEDLLDTRGDFTVEARADTMDQIELIAAGMFDRLRELVSEERQEATDMAGWERFEHDVEPASLKQVGVLKKLKKIYDSVKINPKVLMALISGSPAIRSAAAKIVRNDGGFLHEADENQMAETIQYGKMVTLGDCAYYGVLTDRDHVEAQMMHLCGFDPKKEYVSIDDLPKKSKVGPIDWVKKRSALEMLQNLHQVAMTVELAVEKKPNEKGKMQRHSGMTAALKHYVYKRIEAPLIFTRHFEILEVNDQPVSGVENYGSKRGIQALGGQYIGSIEEVFTVPGIGPDAPIKLKVLWHMSITERDLAIEEIEKRRKKTKLT